MNQETQCQYYFKKLVLKPEGNFQNVCIFKSTRRNKCNYNKRLLSITLFIITFKLLKPNQKKKTF